MRVAYCQVRIENLRKGFASMRVLELADKSGFAWAHKLVADLGADVTRVKALCETLGDALNNEQRLLTTKYRKA